MRPWSKMALAAAQPYIPVFCVAGSSPAHRATIEVYNIFLAPWRNVKVAARYPVLNYPASAPATAAATTMCVAHGSSEDVCLEAGAAGTPWTLTTGSPGASLAARRTTLGWAVAGGSRRPSPFVMLAG